MQVVPGIYSFGLEFFKIKEILKVYTLKPSRRHAHLYHHGVVPVGLRRRRLQRLPLPRCVAEQALEERVGPVLAAIMTSCAPGAEGHHTVSVLEIPTAALGGAPLKRFLAHGKLKPAATPPLLLAASYKAAERLDIKGLVRAVERAVMAAVATGDVRLEEVALAFAGCPRIAGLCDNYLDLPGIRPPPATTAPASKSLSALATEHGAVFLLGKSPSGKYATNETVWVLADVAACAALGEGGGVFAEVCRRCPAALLEPGAVYCVFGADVCDTVDDVRPNHCASWFDGSFATAAFNFKGIAAEFAHVELELVVTAGPRGRETNLLYAKDALAEFTFKQGFNRRYGVGALRDE